MTSSGHAACQLPVRDLDAHDGERAFAALVSPGWRNADPQLVGHLTALDGILHFDGLAPRLALAGVDVAQTLGLALGDAATSEAARLDGAPVLVDLAIVLAPLAAQQCAQHCTKQTRPRQRPKATLHKLSNWVVGFSALSDAG